jgi:hypothetical protein
VRSRVAASEAVDAGDAEAAVALGGLRLRNREAQNQPEFVYQNAWIIRDSLSSVVDTVAAVAGC